MCVNVEKIMLWLRNGEGTLPEPLARATLFQLLHIFLFVFAQNASSKIWTQAGRKLDVNWTQGGGGVCQLSQTSYCCKVIRLSIDRIE